MCSHKSVGIHTNICTQHMHLHVNMKKKVKECHFNKVLLKISIILKIHNEFTNSFLNHSAKVHINYKKHQFYKY